MRRRRSGARRRPRPTAAPARGPAAGRRRRAWCCAAFSRAFSSRSRTTSACSDAISSCPPHRRRRTVASGETAGASSAAGPSARPRRRTGRRTRCARPSPRIRASSVHRPERRPSPRFLASSPHHPERHVLVARLAGARARHRHEPVVARREQLPVAESAGEAHDAVARLRRALDRCRPAPSGGASCARSAAGSRAGPSPRWLSFQVTREPSRRVPRRFALVRHREASRAHLDLGQRDRPRSCSRLAARARARRAARRPAHPRDVAGDRRARLAHRRDPVAAGDDHAQRRAAVGARELVARSPSPRGCWCSFAVARAALPLVAVVDRRRAAPRAVLGGQRAADPRGARHRRRA